MPSPPEETQPKTDSGSGPGQPSERDAHQPPQPQPQYPPVMGFPGYNQDPYANYPNAPYTHQQYAYAAQAPPASYYGSSYPPQQNPVYQRPDPSRFFRGIITGLIIIILFICISTTISWMVLRPQIPNFSVTNFSVSNFNVTGPVFSAQWTANITLENPNTKLNGYFDRIQSFVFHQDAIGKDDYLASTFLHPVSVETKKSVAMGETLTAGEKGQPIVPSWVAEEMRKERETGTVSFSMRMLVWVTFKTSGWSSRESSGLKVSCGKLKVVFDGVSGNGAVLLPKPLPCLVFI